MKVLFVSSGNAKVGISPIVWNQGQSLIKIGIDVDFFTIKGKGLWNYLRHIFILHKYLKTNKFNIIHSHYSYSSFVVAFAGAKPLVVSLMGSDINSNSYSKFLILFFYKLFWTQTIVKTKDMHECLGVKKIEIIPNGVNLNINRILDKEKCMGHLGWNSSKKHVIFAADPNRPEKNYLLAKRSLALLNEGYEVVLHVINDVPYEDMPIYFNAADVLILTSTQEGSPNVIKEAMACNCPIVTTKVGDVVWILGSTEGCFIANFEATDFSEKIRQALTFNKRTNGRERIIKLDLDDKIVAKRILDVYLKVLKKSSNK